MLRTLLYRLPRRVNSGLYLMFIKIFDVDTRCSLRTLPELLISNDIIVSFKSNQPVMVLLQDLEITLDSLWTESERFSHGDDREP